MRRVRTMITTTFAAFAVSIVAQSCKMPASADDEEASESNAAAADPEIVPARTSELTFALDQHDLFSCHYQDDAGKLTVCVEISKESFGNDDEAIRRAYAYCSPDDWHAGRGCPSEGVVASCHDAAIEDGFVYDKFSYDPAMPLAAECAAAGGTK